MYEESWQALDDEQRAPYEARAAVDRTRYDLEMATLEPASDDREVDGGKALPDPLHWYGILVPRELRSAQSCFSSALSSPLVRVATYTRELREVEAAINRTRKAVRRAEKVAESGA